MKMQHFKHTAAKFLGLFIQIINTAKHGKTIASIPPGYDYMYFATITDTHATIQACNGKHAVLFVNHSWLFQYIKTMQTLRQTCSNDLDMYT